MHRFTKDLRAPLFALATCALAVSAARAAEPTFEEQLAKFSNVRVVNAPAATQSTMSTAGQGLKAYKDSETGELRAATQAELEAEAAAASSANTGAVALRSARVAPSPFKVNSATGGTKAMLDDSMMQYSVVTRQPDGTFAEYCATGIEEADAVTKAGVPVASKGERQ